MPDDFDKTAITAPASPPSAPVPPPPWHLAGSAVVMLTGARPKLGVLLALVHYTDSPVGSYNELARAGLTRRGPSVLQMFVDSSASLIGGRRGWGFPKQLAALQWQQHNAHITFRAGTSIWHTRPCGPSFPIRLHAWTIQNLNGESVRVLVQVQGHTRFAFNGKRLALLLETMEMDVMEPEPLRVG